MNVEETMHKHTDELIVTVEAWAGKTPEKAMWASMAQEHYKFALECAVASLPDEEVLRR